jgi:Fe-S cluster assembly protein SufB
MRDNNQLHAAIVELIALDDASIKYSTVQNWYGGDENGRGGIYNFVIKRGRCEGKRSHISWTQVEAGSAITWKYPSVILKGDDSVGEFYSVALTNNRMQADTGTKMIHIGKNTRSTIVSKGISCEESRNSYRGLVRIAPGADNARNFSQCDSMLVGDKVFRKHIPVSRNPQSHGYHRTRGHNIPHQRRSAFLSAKSRTGSGGRRFLAGKRLLQGGVQNTAAGILR